MKKILKHNATFFTLVFFVVVIGLIDPTFFSSRNLSNLTRQVTVIGIISIGMTLAVLVKGIDLSVGSVAGLAAVLVALLLQMGLNVWIACFLTIIMAGLLVGAWNGFWIARYKIPSFIITLGMMTIARGASLTLSNGSSVPITNNYFQKIGGAYLPIDYSIVLIVLLFIFYSYSIYSSIKQKKQYKIKVNIVELFVDLLIVVILLLFSIYTFGFYRGIPVPVLIFGVIAIFINFILSNTKFGRRIYAIGGNEEAARLSGINVFNTTVLIFAIVSILSSLSGIILASRLNGASPNMGKMFELDAVSAVIIGGTSFSGGVGSVPGTVIGVFIIGVLNNGMSIMGIKSFYQLIIKGLIIIIAVWFDVYSRKKH